MRLSNITCLLRNMITFRSFRLFSYFVKSIKLSIRFWSLLKIFAHCLYFCNESSFVDHIIRWLRWQSKIKFQLLIYFLSRLSLQVATMCTVQCSVSIYVFWKCSAKSPTANTTAVFLLILMVCSAFDFRCIVSASTSKEIEIHRTNSEAANTLNTDTMIKCLKFLLKNCYNNKLKVLRRFYLNWTRNAHFSSTVFIFLPLSSLAH